MAGQFEGKVALVTGGSSGIGKATAIAFANEGAKVTVAARREEESRAVVEEIKGAGGDAIFVQTDVAEEAACEEMVAKTLEAFGRLDCAFNNAGRAGGGNTENLDLDGWNQVVAVNMTGVVLSMKYEVRPMIEQGGGAMVNNASVLGLIGMQGGSAYVGTKHAVVGLTKQAALEFVDRNIRVNSVCPGWTMSELTEPVLTDPDRLENAMSRTPMNRYAEPEEIASVVLWLCGDGASFVTGQAITPDGGMLAGWYQRD
jgi:NAD(P)-dependent dehydrogenase (short-subunit alcohol dehydrogenase family)